MSTPITYVEELDDLAAGSTIVVKMNDEGDQTVVWTKGEEGTFTDGETVIPPSAFTNAIGRGSVYRPGNHAIGDRITGVDGRYYKIIGQEGTVWVLAKTDDTGRAVNTSIERGEPLGTTRAAHPALDGAWDLMERLYRAEREAEKLAYIMERGEVPDEVEYRVSVQIKGNVGIQPSEAQARRLIGDNQVTIASVNTTDVAYAKSVVVNKTSRWGCACDQVTAGDLEGKAPGEITSWVVAECADADGNSEVHEPVLVAAAEEAGGAA